MYMPQDEADLFCKRSDFPGSIVVVSIAVTYLCIILGTVLASVL